MMDEIATPEPRSRRLLHAWAVVTVLLALPLVLLGAEVTTKQVGMVDPAWPTSPVHLLGVEWADRGIGYLIEHGHRLAGYCVGIAAIVLAGGLWLREPRRWVRWLGVAALAGVCLQGLLGGLRVLWHQKYGPDVGTTFAMIHGVFGQMVLSLLVCVAVCTSRSWRAAAEVQQDGSADWVSLRRWTVGLTALILCQLVLGALARHGELSNNYHPGSGSVVFVPAPRSHFLAARGHLLNAFVVVAAAAWLVMLIHIHHAGNRRLVLAARWLVGLLAFQIVLGVQAWFIKVHGQDYASFIQELIRPGLFNSDLFRSAHVLVGALVLATSSALTLEAWRRTSWNLAPVAPPASRLEGAA